ncbi:MAG: baseplate J/gp47 family protein [Lachnospiraceae bacterium]|nr:baseplate J/gp47 family protein [Lachnospiraceae bacterium]
MIYVETDAQAIYEQVLTSLQEAVGETLYEGDERRIFAEGLVALFLNMFSTIEDTAKQTMLRWARGEFLDIIGEDKGCTRLEAEKASCTVRYAMNEAFTLSISIPEGSRVETQEGLQFATTRDAVLLAGSTYVDVPVEAVEGGEKYNGIIPGGICIMTDLISYIDTVTNQDTTSGGTDRETDDDYRERARISETQYSTAGSRDAYIYWAKSTTAEISDAKVNCPSANVVDIYIALANGQTASEEKLEEVEDVVTDPKVKALGDLVSVKNPDEVPYDITVTYYVTPEAEAEATEAIENGWTDESGIEHDSVIEQYRIWQDTKIGRNINPNKLIAMMMNPAGDGSVAGASRAEVTYPEFTQLDDVEIARYSGNLTISHVVESE